MPRSWKRSGVETLCGLCNKHININEPVMTIRGLGGATWKVERCAKCAGEPAPENLPLVIERVPIAPTKVLRLGRDTLPLDWKRKQAGEP
jgi:hypothetical protein